MSVSRETKFVAYVDLLRRWGSHVNLTSAQHRSAEALRTLIDDCLCLVPHLPHDLDRLIDLGSGQGFPAIPIAIDTGLRIDLIEADRRKAAFLTTAIAALGLQGTIHPTRIEATIIPPARCVTARALAPVADLARMARPFVADSGCCLFLKGPTATAEILPLDGDPSIQVALLPTTRPPSRLVKVTYLG